MLIFYSPLFLTSFILLNSDHMPVSSSLPPHRSLYNSATQNSDQRSGQLSFLKKCLSLTNTLLTISSLYSTFPILYISVLRWGFCIIILVSPPTSRWHLWGLLSTSELLTYTPINQWIPSGRSNNDSGLWKDTCHNWARLFTTNLKYYKLLNRLAVA